MSDRVIIDTDILIDAGRGVSDAIVCLQQIQQQALLAISLITKMELILGCRNKSEERSLE